MEQDDSFDKDAAYRRFEELLGTADVSFNQGDKVRGCCYPRTGPEFLCLGDGMTNVLFVQ
jgi:hypothetical protein